LAACKPLKPASIDRRSYASTRLSKQGGLPDGSCADPEQGLGKWSDSDIKNAITKAVRPNGEKLAGPMPYGFYAKMTPADLDAIAAFMRTISQ
jgi:hypothetical protein